MVKDVLEQFRNKQRDGNVIAGPTHVTYEAFKAVDKRQYRLKLRPRSRAWERINYSYLYRIVEDGIFGTQIGLVYSFAVVLIKGRNLHPIADAIDMELCEYVQAFDPVRWDMPMDEKAPFVSEIEFHVETRVAASDKLLVDIDEIHKNPPKE